MDWEAPVDAWYVWMAVTIVSVAIAGVALAVPSGPPPDANQAANTVDRVAGSNYQASGSYGHDADEVKIQSTSIALRNGHGTDRASFAYGEMLPVYDTFSEPGSVEWYRQGRVLNVTHGTSYREQYGGNDPADPFVSDLEFVHDWHDGNWRESQGELLVRKIHFDDSFKQQLEGNDHVTDTCPHYRWHSPSAQRHCIEHTFDWIHYDETQETFYVVLVTA